MMKAKELSLDHECFKKIKSSLDYALLLAVEEANEDVVSRITMTIDVSAYDDGDEKLLKPIEYSCNVKSSKEINKDKDSTDSVILKKDGKKFIPYNEQLRIEDVEVPEE
ncbi:MAG: hypothetical protein ACOX3P_03825 [Saccharofermentanales bacterium]|jgi:hypothetical protein|nr:hypothetical protein [Clostridiales bacterium]